MCKDIVIVAAVRTAIGNFNGTLAGIAAHELGAIVMASAMEEAKLEPTDIDDVIMGQVLTAGQGQNPARQASIAAGDS